LKHKQKKSSRLAATEAKALARQKQNKTQGINYNDYTKDIISIEF